MEKEGLLYFLRGDITHHSMKLNMIQVKFYINSNHIGKEAVFCLLNHVFVSGILESFPLVALLPELMEEKKTHTP